MNLNSIWRRISHKKYPLLIVNNAEKFANHVESMSDEKLNKIFVDEKYGTYQRSIEGVIEHSYYHLGQYP